MQAKSGVAILNYTGILEYWNTGILGFRMLFADCY
jgi:hypothetical protein